MICGLGGFDSQARIIWRKDIMRNFVIAALTVCALSIVACGDEDEDTGEAVIDTAAEETE